MSVVADRGAGRNVRAEAGSVGAQRPRGGAVSTGPRVRSGVRGSTAQPRLRAHPVPAERRRRTVVGCSVSERVRRWPALAVLAVAVASGVVGLGLFADGMAAPVPESTAVVVTESGQTLWDLAERFAPQSDTAAVVLRIRRLNELTGSGIDAGMPLVVPSQADTLADNG